MKDFKTRDFPVAAFLKARGRKLLATSRQGNSIIFHFPLEAQADASLYFRDFAIPARSFYGAVKDLKALIHGSRDLANSMKESNAYSEPDN